jgi:RHS repeat-associated protein
MAEPMMNFQFFSERPSGKERDTESGLDYFGARYYGSTMGRFMSPDWSAKAEPVPYAKLGNPQSLNLYSYVWNNPLSRNDPTGHILNCVSNQSQCGSDLSKIAPGTKVGADGTVQKGSLLQRIANHLDGHGDGQALVTRLVNSSTVTGINPASGDAHGGTSSPSVITYDPGGASGVLVRGANGQITTGNVSGATILGHELIHEDHAERGVQDRSDAMHIFTNGGMTFGERGSSESSGLLDFHRSCALATSRKINLKERWANRKEQLIRSTWMTSSRNPRNR